MTKLRGCVLVLWVTLQFSVAEERKPEVKATWDRLSDKVKTDIEKVEPYLYRTLHAYWTDAPPLMDGSLDDACWKEAEVAGDFFVEGSIFKDVLKLPVNQSEVRICYNAANLYIAYKLLDKDMDKLQKGRPQDTRDIIDVHADQVELFLDTTPGEDRTKTDRYANRYFQMCVNPQGTTYDSRGYFGLEWNPDWETKTSITNEFWTVEARIPFHELCFPAEPTATPRKGETWGLMLARDQGAFSEWSRWTSSGIQTNGGFHEVMNFGRLVFMGRKSGAPLPQVATDPKATLSFGRNELSFAVDGGADDGAFTLTRGASSVVETKVAPSPATRVSFDLFEGGDLHARLALTANGAPVYQYDLKRKLPVVAATLATILRETGTVAWTLEMMRIPQAKEMLATCRALGLEAARLKAVFESGAIPKDALDAFQKLNADWRKFSFDAQRLKIYPAGEERAFAALPVDPYVKVFPRQVPTEGVIPEVRIRAAGNERESFQVAFVPFWKELKNVTVTVTPLIGKEGIIPATEVEWFRVDYAQQHPDYRKTLPGFDPDDTESLRDWPDLLWPNTGTLDLPADRITPLWFDARCPPGTKEGAYHGEIVVTADGQTVKIPVTLEAQGFDIPRHPTLKHNHWLSYLWLSRFHGAEFNTKYKEFPEYLKLLERHLQLLEKYRAATYPLDNAAWDWITTYYEKDGSYTFDFSNLEAVLRLSRKYGANYFGSSFGCNPGAVIPVYNGSKVVIDRETGKKMPLKECPNMKPLYEKHKELKPYQVMFHSPFYTQFLQQYVPFLKNAGVLEDSYFELYDESGSLAIIEGHRILRKLAPGLPLMNYGPHPLAKERKARSVGYADCWTPGLDKFDNPEVVKTLKERRAKYGEKYGFYVCGAMERPDGKTTPYLKLSQPTIAMRVLNWFAWKHQVDNYLIFMLFTGFPEKGWPVKPTVAVSDNVGYSPLAYPGPAPDYDLIPSVRLASLRDGMEDYEYFKALHDLGAYLDDQFEPHKKLRERIDAELVVPPGICDAQDEWTKDVEKLRGKREKIAALIREAQAAVDAYPESLLKSP